MILSNKVNIKISPSNIKRFKGSRIGDIISISPFELSKGSSVIISVKCDECGDEKDIKWIQYIKIYSGGDWLCRRCKMRINLQDKYGVDNVFQLDFVKEKSKETMVNRYGVDNISKSEKNKEKVRNTNLEKFGNSDFMSSDYFKNKSKETMNIKYGVDNISKLDIIKEKKINIWKSKSIDDRDEIIKKRKCTNIDRYGYECAFTDDNIIKKIKETNLKRYGYINPSMSSEVNLKKSKSIIKILNKKTYKNINNLITINNNMFEIRCDICSSIFEISKSLFYKRNEMNNIICTICNPISKNISSKELEVLNFIKSIYSGDIIVNDRNILDGKELDIYLPDIGFAIEFNGLYWHCELFKDKNYHFNKFNICKINGIELFHIFEDDWIYRSKIVKSMIMNKLNMTNNSNRIYARNCTVDIIDSVDTVKEFLNNNHLQGYCSSTIKLGLYNGGKLVSIMLFIKSSDDYYLNRFCNIIGYNIIGGASKLFKYFINNYNFSKIITFSNNSYSQGDLYDKIGFISISELRPDYSYIVDGIRRHKFNFRKGNIVKMFENIDISLSEYEILLINNIYRIYDSGKVKWLYKK